MNVERDYSELKPLSSPGETGAAAVWAALGGLLIAFGVETDKALAISGAAAAVTPYIVKLVLWWKGR